MSGLKNPFSPKTRLLFSDVYECWWCGRSHADCLHHIMKRSSASPLNCAPINNNECHLYNPKLHKDPTRRAFLQKTFNYLRSIHYKFTDVDREFVQDNIKYYEGSQIKLL